MAGAQELTLSIGQGRKVTLQLWVIFLANANRQRRATGVGKKRSLRGGGPQASRLPIIRVG
jgi:hypothetical protein